MGGPRVSQTKQKIKMVRVLQGDDLRYFQNKMEHKNRNK